MDCHVTRSLTREHTAIGYAVYFNVFSNKFKHYTAEIIVPVMKQANITDPKIYEEVIYLTSQSLLDHIQKILRPYPDAFEAVVIAGREAYAESYKYVYYVSIGKLTIVAF